MSFTMGLSIILKLGISGGLTACKTVDPILFAYCPPNIDFILKKRRKKQKWLTDVKKK